MIIQNKIITKQDVIKLNLEKKSQVILNNTLGQNPKILSQLSPNVLFKVLGPYDPQQSALFAEEKYAVRTCYKPQTIALAIEQMQAIESQISPNFSELEKAFFVFDSMVKMIEYDYDQQFIYQNRNLESFVIKKARCNAFAMCYKEMMDRLNIKNEFVVIPNLHSFNILNIDNKNFVVDVTWARNKFDEKQSYIQNFGCLPKKQLFLPEFWLTKDVKLHKFSQNEIENLKNKVENLSNQENKEQKAKLNPL